MANPNCISINVLRATINGIFDFIEKDLGLLEVQLNENYYWSIKDDELYSMDQPPKELVVGSLFDDFEFVSSSFKNADRQLPIMFIHIAPILQALSEGVPNFPSPDKSSKET